MITQAQTREASQICDKILASINALQKNFEEMKAARERYEQWLKERES